MKYDLSQKIDGNMIYLYKCINVTRMILPFCQKSKSSSEKNKNTLKGDISSITKKVIFILENTTFLLKYHNN